MTICGAVNLLEQAAALGQRVLVAGYGAFARSAVAELQRRTVRTVAVLDASARAGRVVIRADGDELLQRVVSARVDTGWIPRPGTEQTLEADALVPAFG